MRFTEIMKKLEAKAILSHSFAYCPYSKFQVGASVYTDIGFFSGCNVENASYGLTICAERNAIFSAIAGGASKIKALVIFTPTEKPTAPCGACRQVIREFAETLDIPIYLKSKKETVRTTLEELLPLSFGPEDLK